jgi:hypothetical protein
MVGRWLGGADDAFKVGGGPPRQHFYGAAADLPLAEAPSRRRRGGARRPQLGAAALPRQVPPERSTTSRACPPAPERLATARQLAIPAATVGGILRRRALGKLSALETRPPVVRHQRAQPVEQLPVDTKKLARIAAVFPVACSA